MIRGKRVDAERYLTEQLSKLDSGEQVVASASRRQTLGGWLQEYWETWSGRLGVRTREKYEENLRLYVPEWLLASRLSALTPRMLQDFFNAMTDRVSWTTCSFTFRLLRARLNDAVRHGRDVTPET